jgi:hypothetical protein
MSAMVSREEAAELLRRIDEPPCDCCPGPLAAAVEQLHARAEDLARTVVALHEIISGRVTPPTPEDVFVHASSGGMWLVDYECEGFRSRCVIAPKLSVNDDSTYFRWWPINAAGAPCKWPEVTP